MVMLRMWSVLWRENGHFTEVLTLMEDRCIFYCILWSVVFCFLYTVYLTFKSPHLLILHQYFPPHCKFLHTGEREDFMPAIEQVFQNREGE